MPVEMLVKHCAPTLAGMKVGSLVSYKFTNVEELNENLAERSKVLNAKGLYLKVLRKTDKTALIYLYRKKQLIDRLNEPEIQEFLSTRGYINFQLENTITILEKHFKNDEFPHEIGVFLGYPLNDIKVFIEDKNAVCKCVGCWRAYTDEENAKKTFAKYKKCTKIYCKRFAEGFDISKLTVA